MTSCLTDHHPNCHSFKIQFEQEQKVFVSGRAGAWASAEGAASQGTWWHACMQFTSDQMQATSKVWQLPPMESFRKCVSLDERYGTCFALFFDKAMITCSTEKQNLVLKIGRPCAIIEQDVCLTVYT